LIFLGKRTSRFWHQTSAGSRCHVSSFERLVHVFICLFFSICCCTWHRHARSKCIVFRTSVSGPTEAHTQVPFYTKRWKLNHAKRGPHSTAQYRVRLISLRKPFVCLKQNSCIYACKLRIPCARQSTPFSIIEMHTTLILVTLFGCCCRLLPYSSSSREERKYRVSLDKRIDKYSFVFLSRLIYTLRVRPYCRCACIIPCAHSCRRALVHFLLFSIIIFVLCISFFLNSSSRPSSLCYCSFTVWLLPRS